MEPDRSIKNCFQNVPCLTGRRLILKRVEEEDADALSELVSSTRVYRYLPTFLFEKKYADLHEVVRKLYTECLQESVILGIYLQGELCGLAEMYGLRDEIHKISIGYRLMERFWGQGIASETVAMLVQYLYTDTDIEIITASTMIENRASARVLEKNGYLMTARAVPEDWGYPEPTIADKWFR